MKNSVIRILALVILSPIFFILGKNSFFPGNSIGQGYSFITLDGEKLQLSDFRDKPLLVTFWATDCPSCLEEIPHLIKLHQQYHRLGLQILAINMYYDPPSHVVAMAQAMRLPYPVALDLSGNHAKSFGNVELTPTTFLIDGDGKITIRITGKFDVEDINKRIQALLSEG